MQRRNGTERGLVKCWKLKLVDMKVHYIELLGHAAHFTEHEHVEGDGVANGRVKPKGLGTARDQLGASARVTTGEQSDLVSLGYELLGEIGDDSFGAAIKLWRHAFQQRGDLGTFH